MKNKTKKKMLFLDIWNIEDQEAWFSDMASQGWKLHGIGKVTATFEKDVPKEVKYRCDIFEKKENKDQIEFYHEAGWEFVDSWENIHIFREKNENVDIEEIHTDPVEHADRLSILKSTIKRNAILILICSVLIIMLNISLINRNSLSNYLNDSFVIPLVVIIFYIYIVFLMFNGLFHLSSRIRKLKSGSLLENKGNYRGKILRRKLILSSFLVIFLLLISSVFTNITHSTTDIPNPSIPDQELPILQMEDYKKSSQEYEPIFHEFDDKNRTNYYLENSSILVPKQYELQQNVKVAGVHWEDGVEAYTPNLRSYGYVIRKDWLAKNFMNNLLKEKEDIYYVTFKEEMESPFDELWISKGSHSTQQAFVARLKNTVYYVEYFGMKDIEYIIEQKAEKVIN
ncbi:DUF2812 domain-containing protein [Evansella sp. AB-P1]|uniref:DUF2812 domain-containing protein n=1 Tax=Evansella sp. AB-P1 TaxID=3037653 RepID=UPI00241F08B5|nr:DUF2812 domain-containing protein [Evansella sp. AB-P1]MDG5788629.1 DUF2812 domain-containing protein [Evansella sp. AB-P1]